MKAETNMCRWESRAWNQLIGVQLAIAFMLGLLTQHALVATCVAQEQGSDQALVAAMPEAGTPPSPVATSSSPLATTEAETSAPVPTAESVPIAEPAPSAAAVPLADPNPLPEPVPAPELLPSEPVTAPSSDLAPATAAQAQVAEPESNPRNVLRTEVEVRELSVAPESKPLLPADRPAWVGAAPDLSNPRRHRLFVGSFPTSSAEEADAALDEPMLAAVNGYINEEVLEGRGAQDLNITADFIRHNLVESSTEYMAELSTSTGPLFQKWVVLEITPEHRKFFADVHRQVEQKKRMVGLGLGLTGLLGLTGVAHLAFNRRRRRYTETVQPVVHTLLHDPDAEACKRSGLFLRIIAGSVACVLVLAVLFLGSFMLVYQSRQSARVQRMTIHGSPDVIIHGEAPMPPEPPTPPQAPDVYLEQVKAEHEVLRAENELRRRLHATWGPIEIHSDIKVEGNGDR